jgi:hypothetical protein
MPARRRFSLAHSVASSAERGSGELEEELELLLLFILSYFSFSHCIHATNCR